MKGFSHLRYVGLLACLVLWELLSLLAPPSRAYFATPLETLQECAALVVVIVN
jgi:ABC-type nitrate/sulfonate/bicarbonate transport system permease component